MGTEIRNATEGDIKTVCLLLQTVQNLHAMFYPSIFRTVNEESLTDSVGQMISDPDCHVRLAIIDNKVAGYAVYKIKGSESSVQIHPHHYLFLEHIAVSPTFRRQGIATALLNDFRTYAVQMGIIELRLDVWQANEDAQACFEKAGFSAYNIRMKTSIVTSS